MSLPGNSWGEGGSSKTPLEWKILGGGGGMQIKESSMGGVLFFDHRSVHLAMLLRDRINFVDSPDLEKL